MVTLSTEWLINIRSLSLYHFGMHIKCLLKAIWSRKSNWSYFHLYFKEFKNGTKALCNIKKTIQFLKWRFWLLSECLGALFSFNFLHEVERNIFSSAKMKTAVIKRLLIYLGLFCLFQSHNEQLLIYRSQLRHA